MMALLLRVENLSTYFYTIDGVFKAVDDVCFTIKKEESFGLVGESGCGKSTTGLSIMRMLGDTARIVKGNIIFENEDIVGVDKKRLREIWGKKLFMIFQDPMTSLNPIMKIKKQLEEVIIRKQGQQASKNDLFEIEAQLLKQVELPDPERVLNQYPHQLSGGMKQRVMIAMGIFLNPSLLILDEPTTALDSTVQFKIVELIYRLKTKHKMSNLLITHDFGVAAKLCDRIGVMYAGKIVEQGKYSVLLEEPSHPYTQGLFECIIKPGEKVEYLVGLKGSLPSLTNLPGGCYFRERCGIAKPICRKTQPELVNLGDEHYVACHQVA